MSVRTRIGDGGGSKRSARVDTRQALVVAPTIPDIQAQGTPNRYRYFNALLGSTGADSGTLNQAVDGSSTPQEFYVGASPDYDIRIMRVLIVIADTAVAHNNFGNVSSLSTGWDLHVEESGASTSIINKAKTGGQVIAQSGFGVGYGDGATSFELTNWTGTEDAQTIEVPVDAVLPGGIRLGRGTQDQIVSTVNDNITGLTEFYVRVLGYRHYP